ncbi:MAG: glycoside hydrolase family 25 protein [Lachnospiraceae bacterium]
MRLHDYEDDYKDEHSAGHNYSIGMIAIGVCLCVLLILGVVLITNKKQEHPYVVPVAQTDQVEESASVEESNTFTSDDLEFWSFFSKEEQQKEEKAAMAKAEKEKAASALSEDDSVSDNSVSDNAMEAEALKHKDETLIVHLDGEKEWIPVNPYLTKNEYNYAGLVYEDPIMRYSQQGKVISHMGINVSQENGVIDYTKVKKAGIDFVIIQLGMRGYGTGKVSVDDYFIKNMEGATQAGLSVGVSFYSQAINEQEAVEEASLVIKQLKEYEIAYPVAYDMEEIIGDTARTDALSKEERSKITAAFLKTLSDVGYKTVIYGNKEWLLQKINLSLLSEYKIWLSQEMDVPDYPYQFALWQYSTTGVIPGVVGEVGLNLSFVNYELR